MKIEQILIQPIGQRFNAGKLSIKTFKKTWQVDKRWWNQVICMDETGEMPVDVNIGETYNPLRGRGSVINAIVATVQKAEYLGKDRKKLVIEQYSMATVKMTVDDYLTQEDEWFTAQQDKIKGMIRHGLICALIQSGQIKPDMTSGKEHISKFAKAIINELVDFIMTGE